MGWVPDRAPMLTKVNSFHKMFNLNFALFSLILKESNKYSYMIIKSNIGEEVGKHLTLSGFKYPGPDKCIMLLVRH